MLQNPNMSLTAKQLLRLQEANIAQASVALRRDMFIASQVDKGIMRDDVTFNLCDVAKVSGRTRSILLLLGAGALVSYLVYHFKQDRKLKNEIKKIKAQTDANLAEYEGKKEIDLRYGKTTAKETENQETTTDELPIDNATEVRNWLENFEIDFPIGSFDLPPVIEEYFATCPSGFEVPVIVSVTAATALCFSKVEAPYLDGKNHRANIQALIEGVFGCGKGVLKLMLDTLFKRRIDRDNAKLANPDGKKKIIQTIAPNISAPALADILGNNQGVHAIMVDPEARTIVEALKKNSGISYEILRKAYDNDEHYRMNRDKNAPQGSFPVAINLVVTGTPGDTEALIGKEHEGGTSSRMALCVIPAPGEELPQFDMPKGAYLTALQDQIDEWTDKFAYHTDEEGNDVAAQPYIIDLGYVSSALKEWLAGQFELGEVEGNQARKDLRARIASTVFNCAIVWHMLFGEPTSRQRRERDSIVKLSLYLANYLMERWLHKYGKQHNDIRAKFTAGEMVSVRRTPNTEEETSKSLLPSDTKERNRFLYELKASDPATYSYAVIADKYNITENQAKSFIRQHRELLQAEQGNDILTE